MHALQGKDFDLDRGEIHAAIGERRAGKSSLLRLLDGEVRKTQLQIPSMARGGVFDARHATEEGIGIVHQTPNLVPALSVIEKSSLAESLAHHQAAALRPPSGEMPRDVCIPSCRHNLRDCKEPDREGKGNGRARARASLHRASPRWTIFFPVTSTSLTPSSRCSPSEGSRARRSSTSRKTSPRRCRLQTA